MRFHTAREAMSPVYDCLVQYDDTSMENRLKSRPHQRQCWQKRRHCRRNRQHCVFGNNVAGFGDVAGFSDNVGVFGDIVAGVDGA